MAFTANEMFEQ